MQGNMITKFFGASETTWDKKRSKRRQTDTEGSQSEGEDITTTDIVSKGKARQRKGRLVAKELWSQRGGKRTPAVRFKLSDLLCNKVYIWKYYPASREPYTTNMSCL